jgi:aconitate hydratase
MGVLPLQFPAGEDARSLGLSGEEVLSIEGIAEAINAAADGRDERAREVLVRAGRRGSPDSGGGVEFSALVRIDTPREADYFRHGGILQYVMRALLAG